MYLFSKNKSMKKTILFICGIIIWSIIWWITVYYFNCHDESRSSTVYNLKSRIDKDTNTAYITWDVEDESIVKYYNVSWQVEWWLSWDTLTEEKNFMFTDIPYSKIVNVNVTPYWYWVPSNTIQLINKQ